MSDVTSRSGGSAAGMKIHHGPARVQGADHWTAQFTDELSASLAAVPDMDDPGFRGLVLRTTGERLGTSGAFPVGHFNDYRDHIRAIAYACKVHEPPAAAVTALVDAIRELRPHSRALALLEDCEAALKGLSVLGATRLHSVLTVLESLPRSPDRLAVHDMVRLAARPGETIPLRGSEDLPEVVRRLDGARENRGPRSTAGRPVPRPAGSIPGNGRPAATPGRAREDQPGPRAATGPASRSRQRHRRQNGVPDSADPHRGHLGAGPAQVHH